MNKEQALNIIKIALDNSISKGIASNMQEANAIAMAFNVLLNELKEKES